MSNGPWRPSHYRLTPLDVSPDELVQQVYTVARHVEGLTAELNEHAQSTWPIPSRHHLLTITVDSQPGVWMELGSLRKFDRGHTTWHRHLKYNYGTGSNSTSASHTRIQEVFDFMERAARVKEHTP